MSKNDEPFRLKPIPGGAYDRFRMNHITRAKLPKDSDTFLYDMIDVYGTEKIINMTEVDIGNYVWYTGIRYNLNINVGRTIPWLEDGLKSAERRVLYVMNEKHCYKGNIKKVGSLAGALVEDCYPHGTGAVEDVIYRLGREKIMMIPYIVPSGNFGGMDTLRPASSRYASASLSKYAMDCFFSENGPKFPIYDTKETYTKDGRTEPVYLTSKFPNMLMQWNQGIGRGVASWLGAFNSRDLFKATITLLDDPTAKIDIYPDYAVPVDITNKSDLKGCFDRPKFNVDMRAQYEIEVDHKKDPNTGKVSEKYTVVFTSLPLNVIGNNIEKQIIKINEADKNRNEKRFPEIIHVEIDTNDRYPGGIRFIVEYEKGYDPEVLVDKLFASTSLRKVIPVDYSMITDNQPFRFTPRNILLSWISQRFDQKRRFYHQKALYAAKERAKFEALVAALATDDTIDKTISAIRASKTDDQSIAALRKLLNINDFQARCILQISLKNLQKMDIKQTRADLETAIEDYKYYRKLLSSEHSIKDKIREELEYGLATYGQARRANLCNLKNGKIGDPETTRYLVYNNNMYYAIDNLADLSKFAGSIDKSYRIMSFKNRDNVIVFSENGGIRILDGYSFSSNTQGIGISTLGIPDAVQIISAKQPSGYNDVVMITKDGYGKIMEIFECTKSNKGRVINLNTDDKLVAVVPVKTTNEESDIIGMVDGDTLIYTKLSSFPRYKRSSTGNRIVKTKKPPRLQMPCILICPMLIIC